MKAEPSAEVGKKNLKCVLIILKCLKANSVLSKMPHFCPLTEII